MKDRSREKVEERVKIEAGSGKIAEITTGEV